MMKSLHRIEVLARTWGRTALAAVALLALILTQTIAVAIQPGNVDSVLNEARNYDRRLDLNRGLKAIEEALGRLVHDCGSHFDPAVVHHFIPIARAEMPSVFAATGVSQSTEL